MFNRTLHALLIVLLCAVASAQPKPENRTPSGLVLEVVFVPGVNPAYQTVPRSETQPPRGTWYGWFAPVKGWKLPANASPIQAVNIIPYLHGDDLTINVSVIRGEQLHEVNEFVAIYKAQENQTIVVEPLKSFGVEPFVLRVVRIGSTSANQPVIRNLTKSLEVVGVEAVISTLPRFKLTLHNLSTKQIVSVKLEVTEGQKAGCPCLLVSKIGHWLTAEKILSSALRWQCELSLLPEITCR